MFSDIIARLPGKINAQDLLPPESFAASLPRSPCLCPEPVPSARIRPPLPGDGPLCPDTVPSARRRRPPARGRHHPWARLRSRLHNLIDKSRHNMVTKRLLIRSPPGGDLGEAGRSRGKTPVFSGVFHILHRVFHRWNFMRPEFDNFPLVDINQFHSCSAPAGKRLWKKIFPVFLNFFKKTIDFIFESEYNIILRGTLRSKGVLRSKEV